MNKKLQGYVAGLLIGASFVGVTALSKSATEMIEVSYNNIKIKIDGVKTEPKDANGVAVEPFIYNGTTYLPVRAVSEAFGMQVEWAGDTNTVMIYDKTTPKETYLVEACPYYQTNFWAGPSIFKSSEGKSFEMFGNSYTNGLTIGGSGGFILYALNGRYSEMTFECGFAGGHPYDTTLNISLDGNVVKSIRIDNEATPQKYTIPLNYATQMTIFTSEAERNVVGINIGIGNIVLR